MAWATVERILEQERQKGKKIPIACAIQTELYEYWQKHH